MTEKFNVGQWINEVVTELPFPKALQIVVGFSFIGSYGLNGSADQPKAESQIRFVDARWWKSTLHTWTHCKSEAIAFGNTIKEMEPDKFMNIYKKAEEEPFRRPIMDEDRKEDEIIHQINFIAPITCVLWLTKQ